MAVEPIPVRPSPVDEADEAASASRVRIAALADMAGLRAVSGFFEDVWGRADEGVPIGSETMRSLVHAGGAVHAAYDEQGRLVGAACLALAAAPMETYGLLAAAAPDLADRGIGYAVKLAQRAWALERGLGAMAWTFDPLVARNGRFNLVKLGAVAREYDVAFYGRMSDPMNGPDEGDRLVAAWDLRAPLPVRRVEPDVVGEVAAVGPDGSPMVRIDGRGRWVRVPDDVVRLRQEDPAAASAWRYAVREQLGGALARGGVAVHVTRDGWYLVEEGGS